MRNGKAAQGVSLILRRSLGAELSRRSLSSRFLLLLFCVYMLVRLVYLRVTGALKEQKWTRAMVLRVLLGRMGTRTLRRAGVNVGGGAAVSLARSSSRGWVWGGGKVVQQEWWTICEDVE